MKMEGYTDIYLSKETYYTMAYLRLYTNISLITIYDFYDGGCEDNTETYWEIFSHSNSGSLGILIILDSNWSQLVATWNAKFDIVDADLTREQIQGLTSSTVN